MSEEERRKLLPINGVTETSDRQTRWGFLLKLAVVLVIYKGSYEIYFTTLKQYIFAWCENSTTSSNLPGDSTGNTTGNNTQCGKNHGTDAQKLASKWELYFDLLNAVLVYFSVSIGGTLSDHYGRKVFFCLALFGQAFIGGLSSVVIYFNLHIAWMFLGYGVDGICGSAFMISLMTFAGTADSTSGTQGRVLGMTVMEAVMAIGRLTTQFCNGYFIHDYGFFYPMLTAAAGTLFSLIVAMAFMDVPQSSEYQPNLPLPSFRTLFRRYVGFYTDSDKKDDRKIFWICFFAFFLTEFAVVSRSNTLTLYQLGSPFCWSSKLIGWYNALYICVTLIIACLILKLLQLWIPDQVILCTGTVSAIAFCVMTGVARSTATLFAAIGVGLLMELLKSILRGMTSSRASSKLQGAMFAGLESSELICMMVATPSSLSLYGATVAFSPGLVFHVLAGVYGLTLVFLVYLCYLLRRERNQYSARALTS